MQVDNAAFACAELLLDIGANPGFQFKTHPNVDKARFVKEFEEEAGATPMPPSKPDDYKQLFEGNHDDCFRCAYLSFTTTRPHHNWPSGCADDCNHSDCSWCALSR